jgi:hypothetical protein
MRGGGAAAATAGGADSGRLREELGAMQRRLDASLMVRNEHDYAVGRYREEQTSLLSTARRELDDFFSVHSVKVRHRACLCDIYMR